VIALYGVLLASLAGSVHCTAMCGPFVCVYAGVGRSPGTARSHVAYHLGRLLSYALLGALAGSLGRSADQLGLLVGISRGAAIFAGALMVGWGVSTILAARGAASFPRAPWATLRLPLGALLARLRGRPAIVRAGATGLLTTLLPCGWLYTFVAAAAGSGSAVGGVATMAIFWLGTLPALTVLGAVAQRLAGRFGPRLPVAAASLVVLLGLLTIAGRMGFMPTLAPDLAHSSAH
jgi:sulfite exporter TauE/SafE